MRSPADKNLLKIFVAISTFLLTLLLTFCSVPSPKDSLTVTILHTNDHHGHTLPHEHQGRFVGGLAERIALIKRLKREARSTSDMCLLVDAGDISSGTLFSDFFTNEPDWKVYAQFYDAIVPGNHDFDFPFDRVFSMIKTFQAPVLSANLYDRGSGELFFPPYKIFRQDSWSLALIGISHPDTPLISTLGYDERLEFRAAVEATKQYVQELRKKHDLIVVLSHLGEDDRLAKKVDGIDLIIGGHIHTPLEKPLKVNNTLIIKAGYAGQYVGHMELSLQRRTRGIRIKMISYKLIPVSTDIAPDEKVLSMLQPFLDSYGDRGRVIVGEAGEAFNRNPLADPMSSSNLANLVTDAYRFVTGADLAFVNKGGLRADLDKGPVTVEELHAVLPFHNTLIVFEIKGEQVIEIIQRMASGLPSKGGILFPSNLDITIRKSGLKVVLTGDGGSIEPELIYTVAVGSFIARGGDGHLRFPAFKQKTDTKIRTSDALRMYFEAKGTLFPDNKPRLKRGFSD
ncbi:MAG: bifunctional UDP-sugar hydrolase/5'-nucleotidase [Candidatus Aminicenantes bacterium]|jgi:2',3'-cyclic-nucleotide 2'-phosphodiesterase (5'-nucleotidase family)